MPLSTLTKIRRAPESGFSLVEILVGMAIAMLGVVIMLQVFSVSESNKRATTGSDDAQNNGAIALFTLQRDLREAGYGINSLNVLGCDILLRAGVTLKAIAPITINQKNDDGTSRIPPGDTNTDTILVVQGNAGGSPEGDGITQQPAANIYSMMTPTSFNIGDWVIVGPQTRGATCSLTLEQVLSKPVGTSNITVTTGVAGMSNPIAYNQGAAPRIQAYAVRNGNLTVCNYMANDCSDATKKDDAAVWLPIANNVVSMRVQYGRDTNTPMDTVVNLYDQTTPTTACDWVKAPAVRLVLVARSGQYEKEEVTAAAPAWAASNADNPAGSTSAPIDISKMPDGSANAEWKHYRYKAFETVVPIRNIVSLGGLAGC
jgi:type IV pilus assembly protein PilW